ncbi:hypothetical protein HY768_02675 [candidate division TA06 bacterium]|uniref:Uncharacterized protein n=1 Tax=candidate division TA06 bacterium TaxID=2250710 RepID=A0A933MJM5_UNCT6|nr:hypothetical protein [candidate division TA06 bacterium]
MSLNPWVWIAAILSLAIFSYLYKDNPAFRFAEHLFTGLSVGYYLVLYYNNYAIPYLITPLTEHRWITLIPMALGMMYLFRFIPKLNYLILIPIAISLGFLNGMNIPLVIEADVLKQVQGTMINTSMLKNIWDPQNGLIAGILILLGVVSSISYFYFSREHKGALKVSANMGIWFVMIGFGATFGYTVMARVSLLIARVQFLFTDWIHLIK